MLVELRDHLFSSIYLAFLVTTVAMALACGSEEIDDQDVEDDTGVIDAGPDTTAPDTDLDAGPEPDAEPDVESDVDIPDDAPEAMDDYLVCDSDIDCPINGSRCVDWLTYNRPDADGVSEVPMWEVFEELEDGQGICTRDCSEDPTVCDTVFWSDPAGQAFESTCLVVATGTPPYQVTSTDPFEVELDFEEMEQGQSFGAICLPPFDRAEGRSESFCAPCSLDDDCTDDTRCYNALTDQFRQDFEERGDSFCVEACEADADCPMGFICDAVGDGDEAENVCLPVHDTCTDCIDRDENGFGTGHCGPSNNRQTPFDCDDTNPDAYFDSDDMTHPFPQHCYDDPGDEATYFNDLNCSGVLDHEEQVGTEEWGAYHCTECHDECTGETDGGFRVCQIDDDGAPYCGLGCEPGYAVCNGDPADGCPIVIAEEEAKGEEKPYRDEESDYIWYDAPEGAEWATSEAEPHFFCSEEEAQEELDNPTQKRGCHPDEPGAHPEAQQLCDDIDWNCSGLTGPDDPETTDEIDGQTLTVGQSCQIDDAQGLCREGIATCSNDSDIEMTCQPEYPQYPTTAPLCSTADTTCDGQPDTEWDGEFTVGGEEIILLDADGNIIDENPDTVFAGDHCEIPGELGQCRIGEVRCGSSGLYCEQVNFPQPEKPGFDGIDHSCDGFERHLNDQGEPHVIYVDGSTEGPDLAEAIVLAAQCELEIAGQNVPCDVFVQDFSPSLITDQTIELIEGVHVYGGFDVDNWDPTEGEFVAPQYGPGNTNVSTVRVDASPGMRAIDIEEETHFSGIHLTTYDMDEQTDCAANIGAICNNCPGMVFESVQIASGAAARGADGGDASPRDEEVVEAWGGSFGVFDPDSGPINRYSRAPGGYYPDLEVAYGGDSGNMVEPEGLPGWPEDGEKGGHRGSPHGGHGIAIDVPAPPLPHQFSLSETNLWATCPTATQQTVADDSHGGGGVGSDVSTVSSSSGWVVAVVAGGGYAGLGGNHGEPGGSGSPSLGMVLIDTPLGINDGIEYDDLTIRAGAGGTGGDGGAGGAGTAGGDGAEGSHLGVTEEGGDGGDGAGGNGGNGGNGGPSIALFRANSSVGSTPPGFENGGNTDGGSGGMGGAFGGPDSETGNNGLPGLSAPGCNNYDSGITNGAFPVQIVYDPENCIY